MKNHWQPLAGFLFSILFAGLAAGTSFSADPLDTWERVGQIQTNVVSLQLLNGQLAAVGGGQVHVSSNGVAWRAIRPPNNPVQAVGFGAGTYLAVGSNVVSVSADLTNWTSRLLGSAVNLRTVAFGKDVFVATGDGQAWFTSNGSDWFRATGTLGARQNATLFNGTEFLSVGVDYTVIASSDGQVWKRVISGHPIHLLAVASDGSYWYSVANGGVFVKERALDGTWGNRGDFTNAALSGVAYGNGVVVCVGETGLVWTSRDSTNWIGRFLPEAVALQSVVFAWDRFWAVTAAGQVWRSGVLPLGDLFRLDLGYFPGVRITGTPGASFVIEARNEFGPADSWQPVARLILPASPYLWIDPASPPVRRFYRAVQVE